MYLYNETHSTLLCKNRRNKNSRLLRSFKCTMPHKPYTVEDTDGNNLSLTHDIMPIIKSVFTRSY